MTDKNKTRILAIADRSGSMRGLSDRMEEALNNYFLEQSRLPGNAYVDYVQFDTEYELVYEDRPAYAAKAVIEPRGGTALLDAIGRASVELGDKLRKLPEDERPGTVQVVIVTDGYENSSVDWTYEKVKALIEEQEGKYNWDFVFLGANIDAVAVGARFGIKSDSALTYDIYNAEAVGATSAMLSSYTTTYRGGGKGAFSDEDRKAAVGS